MNGLASGKKTFAMIILLIIICVSVMFTILGCGEGIPEENSLDGADEEALPVVATPVLEGTVTVKLALVGDIMVHADQVASAYDVKSGEYLFDGWFTDVADYLSPADLTVGNLETTLAGKDKGFTGYPQFNTPEQILPSLLRVGFDVLVTANNHSLDRRTYGVLKTIEHLDSAGMKHTGTFSSAEERSKTLILDIHGVKIAILAYTYGTNGIPVPNDKIYLVNLLDMEKIKQDITNAREEGAEVVLVYPHYGIEYRRIPGVSEKKLVEELFAAGADIVAGSHPHVLQPMFRRDILDDTKGLFVAYSLGNFISGQRGQYKDSGVILVLTLEKDLMTNEIRLTEADYIPTWVHKYRKNGKTHFRVLAVEKALRDYREGMDKTLTAQDYARLQQVWKETTLLLSGPEGPAILNV